MKRMAAMTAMLFVVLAAGADAAEAEGPPLPDPPPAAVDSETLRPDADWIRRSPGLAPGRRRALADLAELMVRDPQLRNAWDRRRQVVARQLKDWRTAPRKGRSYLDSIPELAEAAVFYRLCGLPELGQFIRDHLLYCAKQSKAFYLKWYDRKHPQANTVSATAGRSLALAYDLAGRELMSEAERAEFEAFLREMFLSTSARRLRRNDHSPQRFCVAASALTVARALGDEAAAARMLTEVKREWSGLAFPDGSLVNGCSALREATLGFTEFFLALTPAEREAFDSEPFRTVSRYLLITDFHLRNRDGLHEGSRLNFNLSSVSDPPALAFLVSAGLRGDPAASTLGAAFWGTDWYCNRLIDLLLLAESGFPEIPAARNGDDLMLPETVVFDNGESVLRSGWDNEAVLAAMAGAAEFRGNFNRAPESNSVALAAFGEFLVMPPGTAYGRKSHETYNYSTVSANTVMIDDRDQKSPSAPKANPRAVRGRPGSSTVTVEDNPEFAAVVRNSAAAYAINQELAVRALIRLKKSNALVVIDRFSGDGGPHRFDLRWHLCRREKNDVFDELGNGRFQLRRRRTILDIACWVPDGFRHRVSDAYMAIYNLRDGRNKGAVELKIFPESPRADFTAVTVLSPRRREAAAVPVSFDGRGGVEVGGVRLRVDSDGVTVGDRRLNWRPAAVPDPS